MGFIGVGGTRLNISSRFDSSEQNHFLFYMLSRVLHLNLFDLKSGSDDTSLFDIYYYLLPYCLKQALNQGLYKEYQRRQYNDSNIKGAIDVSRHLRLNTPFLGRIAYNTREMAFDNHITQLIRHTLEFMRQHPVARSVLLSDEMREMTSLIVQATPSYSKAQRQRIIAQNLTPVVHPYFSAYRPLQQLCLSILRYEKCSHGASDDKVHGILFDGAWLWEEYLATVLTDFVHPENKNGKGCLHLFREPEKSGTIYPDFYRPRSVASDEADLAEMVADVVLDAKYKDLWDDDKDDSVIPERDDRFQIISYMHVLRAPNGGIIYPRKINDDGRGVAKKSYTLYGYGDHITTYGVSIPNAETIEDFTDKMRTVESDIKSQVQYEDTAYE